MPGVRLDKVGYWVGYYFPPLSTSLWCSFIFVLHCAPSVGTDGKYFKSKKL